MKSAALDRVARRSVETLARTWRVRVTGEDVVERLRESGHRLAFAVWHARLLVPLWHRRREGIALLISQHADAEKLARAGAKWGYEVVRGSSTRGGVMGLKGMMRALHRGIDIATTPDGPRGPAGIAKPGLVWAAVRAGATIIPIGVHASSNWYLSSWDRFHIPKIGARVHLLYGKPLQPQDAHPDALASSLCDALNQAENESEWRQ